MSPKKSELDTKKIWLYVLSVLVLINTFLTTSLFISLERVNYVLSVVSPITVNLPETSVVPPSLSITGNYLFTNPVGISMLTSIALFLVVAVAWYRGLKD